jgi:hypothetical protein
MANNQESISRCTNGFPSVGILKTQLNYAEFSLKKSLSANSPFCVTIFVGHRVGRVFPEGFPEHCSLTVTTGNVSYRLLSYGKLGELHIQSTKDEIKVQANFD